MASFLYERTLRRPVEGQGVGLHSGAEVAFRLLPAAPGTGIVFVRRDPSARGGRDGVDIPAGLEYVQPAQYATVLAANGASVGTVEHLLSTAAGLGIDNLRVELWGPEVPIFDGSAKPFVAFFREGGVETHGVPRRVLVPQKSLSFRLNGSRLALHVSSKMRISYTIDFPGTMVSHQELSLVLTPETFEKEIAPARTFGFARDVEAMRRSGHIRGATLESAILVGEEGIVNGTLRFPDEFVRHKILDAIGDFALVGTPWRGHFTASKAGHQAHTLALKEWLADPEAFATEETTEEDAALSQLA
jgi:UDP-3-O-[3-hydroxymyristoyl] N-acetylglucosamine deacetylase